MVDTISVSAKGQVAIPVAIRRRMAIHKGDKLVVIFDKGKLMMIPAKEVLGRGVRDEFIGLTQLAEGSARELWDNDADELWNKM